MSEGETWWPSRYGADDRVGTANELTEERTLAALSLPRSGRVLELAQVLDARSPTLEPRSWRQLVIPRRTLEAEREAAGRLCGFDEYVAQSYHVGCHLDALGHCGIGNRYYNGLPHEDVYDDTGLAQLGIEAARPWVCRGVCLDVAGLLGAELLDEGFLVTVEHLERAAAAQDVEVRAGDAVLVHTGWGSLWETDPARYGAAEPGLALDAGRWLAERRVSLAGADNWALEAVPFEDDERPFAVHQHLIARNGVYVLENVRTDELAAGRYGTFLFVLAPIRTRGSTASMAAPLAVV